ncbi:MAG: rRNA pseudouridine synthase, partial [Rhodospirillum sp.]|nr:rRNA pseudouridine synthase [Rhodospirillum sp.]
MAPRIRHQPRGHRAVRGLHHRLQGRRHPMTDPETDSSEDTSSPEGERLAKVIARAGICSRRDAEKLIEAGRVTLNGRQVAQPAPLVTPGDTVVVDGKPLPDKEPPRLWRYHKPAGLVTSHKDPQGRPTVFDRLPGTLPRVISVGRLDLNSEGLLLLTNDGELARELEHPTQGWLRRYRVRIHGRPDPVKLAALENGVTVDGVNYGSIKAILERQTGANAWISVSLREGKNREIRRVMDYLGMPVSRLLRVSYGPFQLGQLEPGAVEEIPGKTLREQLGKGAPMPPKRQHTKAARELEAKRESSRRETAGKAK